MNYNKISKKMDGSGVKVAFVDTGIHEDFADKINDQIVYKYNVINNSKNIIDNDNEHGTNMICIAICDYNRDGIHGLSQDIDVMVLVAADSVGRTSGEYLSEAIRIAVDNGADIINISLASKVENDLVKSAVKYAYDSGVLVSAAVGDYSEEKVLYPAKYTTTIAVQAQSKLGGKYIDSSYGDEVDIMLPGELLKTLGIDSNGDLIETEISGSSGSTVIMSTIMSLMLEKNSNVDVYGYIRDYYMTVEFLDIDIFLGGLWCI